MTNSRAKTVNLAIRLEEVSLLVGNRNADKHRKARAKQWPLFWYFNFESGL